MTLSKIKRLVASVATSVALTGAFVAADANAAFAACSPSSGYNQYTHEISLSIYCGSDTVAHVEVYKTVNDTYKILVYDEKCDSTGPYWRSWQLGGGQFVFGDVDGCGSKHTTKEIGTSTVILPPDGTTKNWWVVWGGWNSPAMHFPT
jgi:hypothetical protein